MACAVYAKSLRRYSHSYFAKHLATANTDTASVTPIPTAFQNGKLFTLPLLFELL